MFWPYYNRAQSIERLGSYDMCIYFDQIMNSRSFWGPPDDMIWLDMIVHIQILFERDKCDKKKNNFRLKFEGTFLVQLF